MVFLCKIRAEEPFLAFCPDGRHVIQVSFHGAIRLRIFGWSDSGFLHGHVRRECLHYFKKREMVCWYARRLRDCLGCNNSENILPIQSRTGSAALKCKVPVYIPFFGMSTHGMLRYCFQRTQATYFTALDASPDSSKAAVGDSTGSTVLLRIPTGEQLAVCACDRGLYLDSLQFSPAGDCIVVGPNN